MLFFTKDNWAAHATTDDHGTPSSAGGLYSGGSAQMVENSLGVHGDEILYVGDHIYTDVSQSKVHLRWRTALICRELEEEVSNTSLCLINFWLKNSRISIFFSK